MVCIFCFVLMVVFSKIFVFGKLGVMIVVNGNSCFLIVWIVLVFNKWCLFLVIIIGLIINGLKLIFCKLWIIVLIWLLFVNIFVFAVLILKLVVSDWNCVLINELGIGKLFCMLYVFCVVNVMIIFKLNVCCVWNVFKFVCMLVFLLELELVIVIICGVKLYLVIFLFLIFVLLYVLILEFFWLFV